MFYRKISKTINNYLENDYAKILCVDGARKVGKSFIIRQCASKKFKNYIEINMADDKNGDKLFESVGTINDFYLQVSVIAGNKLGSFDDTIIFIDEIQEYPRLLTLLKPLKADNRFKYICSGSQLGIALSNTELIPIGSFEEVKMYPMDFEEFLLANSVGSDVISYMKDSYINKRSLENNLHNKILYLFKTYLYVGGMPEAVKEYVETKNVFEIRKTQSDIYKYYGDDASKYDKENRLKIKMIYDLVPSNIENKVKRLQFKMIEKIDDARYQRYINEFDYLISSGIVLDNRAISEPKFPLLQSSCKNLLKLYMNDVGLLTNCLYKNNINAILNNQTGVNLGAVYETVVAQELKCHGHSLYYYDRKKVGEVDYLIDDYDNLSVLPIEVKSGQDERNFRALPKLINNENYKIKHGIVLSNNRDVMIENKIIYMPIYYAMFI